MGTKRVGLARTQALLENLKREIDLSNSTTLKGMNLTVANESATYGAGMVSTEIAPQTSIQTIGGDIVTISCVAWQPLRSRHPSLNIGGVTDHVPQLTK